MNRLSKGKIGLAGSLILLAVFTLPMFSFAKHEKKLFVNDDAGAVQDGSVGRPFKTIRQAINKANKNTEIHVSNGTYRESITLPKGVELFGQNRDKVVIISSSKSQPVVTMSHDTKINKVTVRGGESGIRVRSESKAEIINVRIESNKEDGVKIIDSKNSDKFRVNLSENVIRNNGRHGIFSERRKLSVMDNDIEENKKDGLHFESGVKAFLKDNNLEHNERSGAFLTLDDSDIFADDNSYRSNDRHGVEVTARGKAGKVTIEDSKITRNDRFGIAKVAQRKFAESVWNGLVVAKDNSFLKNKDGNLSAILTK